MVFERFTDRARRVQVRAQGEARLLGQRFTGTEHLLLGLVHDEEGVAGKALDSLGIRLEEVREKVVEAISSTRSGVRASRPGASPAGSLPFTARARKVLELAGREAAQMGHDYIGTEHMLLGLIREGEGGGARVLVTLGVGLDQARQAVLRCLGDGHGERGGPLGW